MSYIGPQSTARSVPLRAAGKLPSTTVTNELATAINERSAGQSGPVDSAGRACLIVYVTAIYDACPGGGYYCAQFQPITDLRIDTTTNVNPEGNFPASSRANECVGRYPKEKTATSHVFTDGGAAWPGGIGIFYGWAKDHGGAQTGDPETILPVYTIYERPTRICATGGG